MFKKIISVAMTISLLVSTPAISVITTDAKSINNEGKIVIGDMQYNITSKKDIVQSSPQKIGDGDYRSNPFAEEDNLKSNRLSTYKQEKSNNSVDKTAQKSAEMSIKDNERNTSYNGYIVKFKDTITYGEISALLSPYQYKMISDSEHRMFSVETDSLDTLKASMDGKYDYIEQNNLSKQEATTNDPQFASQWALTATNIPSAWDIETGSSDVTVAMIDSGVYRSHEDLINSDIRQGWDYLYGEPVNWDSVGHGTQTTGIIAATANNSKGISGVCWNVAIIPLLVVGTDGYAETADICAALYDAADIGVDVINLSLGSSYPSYSEKAAISYAISKGCIVVAAAGNDGMEIYSYPASFDGVISVASINSSLQTSEFSSFNDAVDVAAPGDAVLSTCDINYSSANYAAVYGTSFSSPYVAGIAALARSYNDNIDSYAFQEILENTSTDRGTAGYDIYYGNGIVNAEEVLNYIEDINPTPTPTPAPLGDYTDPDSYPLVSEGDVIDILTDSLGVHQSFEFYEIYDYYDNSLYFSVITACTNANYKDIYSFMEFYTLNSNETLDLNYYAYFDTSGGTEWQLPLSFDKTNFLFSEYIYVRIGLIPNFDATDYSDTTLFKVANPTFIKVPPDTPTNVKAVSNSYNSVEISWDELSGVTGYKVYQSTSSGGPYTTVADTNSASYIKSSLTTGTTYYYKVQAYVAVDGQKVYGYSSAVTSAKPLPNIPANAKAAPNTYNSIKISWDAVPGVTGYKVYRSSSSSGTYTTVADTASTSYINSSLANDTTYYYKVQAYTAVDGQKVYGYSSSVLSSKPVTTTPPIATAASNSYNSIKINWNAVSGVSGYKVYRCSSSNGIYTTIADTTSTYYYNFSLTTGTTYYYKVQAYTVANGQKVYGYSSVVVSAKPLPNIPANVKASSYSYNSIKISWNAVSGITGYKVYRSTSSDGPYTTVADTASTNFINLSLTTGTTYYYKVQAYTAVNGQKVYGYCSTVVSAIPTS